MRRATCGVLIPDEVKYGQYFASLISSCRAWPATLLWPKRSVMNLPVARSITSKVLFPLGLTMKPGVRAGAVVLGF